jgi:hypothetical protein|tara:strand:- start:1280 stop:2011 length:732 start_codon:yes stop_codon:yes gene_type:complete
MSQNNSNINSIDDNISNFLLNTNVEINFFNFFIAILLSAFLAQIIKFTYIKVSSSLNDKEHFSETFVPLAIITTLVITVIKFSLALSLGLVGALSIVRFRAAIKEPEELVYLFLAIAIGLANGANQFVISIVSTILITLILYLRKLYNENKKDLSSISVSSNLMQVTITDKNISFDKIEEDIKNKVDYLKLKSLTTDENETQYNFWFGIKTKNSLELIRLIEDITKNNKKISIQIFSRTGIYE